MFRMSMHAFKAGGKKQTFQALLFTNDLDAQHVYLHLSLKSQESKEFFGKILMDC